MRERVQKFLGRTVPSEIGIANNKNSKKKVTEISQKARMQLEAAFKPHNNELYQLLDDWPGPPMEESPFSRFER